MQKEREVNIYMVSNIEVEVHSQGQEGEATRVV